MHILNRVIVLFILLFGLQISSYAADVGDPVPNNCGSEDIKLSFPMATALPSDNTCTSLSDTIDLQFDFTLGGGQGSRYNLSFGYTTNPPLIADRRFVNIKCVFTTPATANTAGTCQNYVSGTTNAGRATFLGYSCNADGDNNLNTNANVPFYLSWESNQNTNANANNPLITGPKCSDPAITISVAPPIDPSVPRLTLKKVVSSGTAPLSAFTLRARRGPAQPNHLELISGVDGSSAVTNAAVSPGVYALNEDIAVPGYVLSSLTCTNATMGGTDVSGVTVGSQNVTLAANDKVTCTFTNDSTAVQLATLTLLKDVTNNDGGIAVDTSFTLRATGNTQTISGIEGSANVTNASVAVGTYTLSEVQQAGYTASVYSCVKNGAAAVISNTLTLANNDVATCTITNNDNVGTYTMTKTSDTATISMPGTITYTFAFTNSGTTTLTNLTVSDSNIDSGTLSCNDDGDMDGDIDSLAAGASNICTATRAISQAQIDAGTAIVNTATPSATAPNGTTVVIENNTANDNSTTTTITQTATYDMVKTSDTPTISAPGSITYTFTFTNTGNVSLSDLTVADAQLDAGSLTCANDGDTDGDINTLAVGAATLACSGTRTVTQADIDAGTDIVNTATPSTSTAGATEDNTANNTTTTTITQTATYDMVKTSDTPTISAPGSITYTFTFTNTGNVSLSDLTVADAQLDAGSLTCANDGDTDGDINTLAVGAATLACSGTRTVTQADIDAGTDIVNTATPSTSTAGATEDNTANNTTTTTITQAGTITVEKSSTTANVSAPGAVNYSYLVTNTGNVTITALALVDDNVDAAPVCSATTLTVAPAAGSTTTCTATHTFTQAELNANGSPVAGSGFLTNNVVASSNEAPDAIDDLSIPISQSPALMILKSLTNADDSVVDTLGETIEYTITVENTGNVDLTNVVITDTFAGGAIYSSGDDGDNILETTETWTYTADYVVTQADLNAGIDLVNVATVVTDQTAQQQDDATSSVITSGPSLRVEKSVNLVNISAPSTLNYTINVINAGDVDITNVVLSDPFAGGASFDSGDTSNPGVLDVGEVWVYSATYAATQADINAGTDLVNTASVVTTEVPGPTTGSATTTITQTPSLTVVQNVDLTNISAPNTLTYTITLNNIGNVDLTNVVLSDDLAGTATLDSGDAVDPGVLNVGETWIYSATYAATQADINAGTDLVNTASVVTTEVPGPTEDSATTTITQSPELTLVKSITGGDPYAAVNDVISYSFLVTNNGNVSLTGPVTVNDDKASDESCPAVSTVGNLDAELDPTETITCTATYTVTQADINAGSVTNIADATADGTTSPTDTATATASQGPSWNVIKATSSTPRVAGDTLDYTFTLDNTGNVTIDNVVVTDVKCSAAPTLTSGDTNIDTKLDVDEVHVYSCTSIAVTLAETTAGIVDNNVSVSGTPAGGTLADATDSLSTPITPNPIVANPDAPAPINGKDGGTSPESVLDNDTLDGNPVDPADVTLSVNDPDTADGVSVNPDGTVTVDPLTPAGSFVIEYTICENLNPTNCSTENVSVSVTAAPIVAVADSATVTDLVSGATGLVNVLDNDSLNGVSPVDPAEVTLSETVSDPAGALTLNPDGSVDVAPNTPPGNYELTYQICEILNPANCSSNTVMITGGLASISGSVWQDSDKDGIFDTDERALEGWTVQVLDSSGNVVASALVNADGTYQIGDIPANTAANPEYSVIALHPFSGAVYEIIPSLILQPNDALVDIDLAIDPSGVIYDSITRSPVAGAIVEILGSNGQPLPAVCLFTNQQGQETDSDGYYRFDINITSGDPACPASETVYTIRVTAPVGYSDPVSLLLAAQSGPLDITGLGMNGLYQVAPFDSAPQPGQSTEYYMSFAIAQGDPDAVNNHIPLDPDGASTDMLRVTKTSTKSSALIGELVPYTITVENISAVNLNNVELIDDLPAGFTFVSGSETTNDADGQVLVSGSDPVIISGVDILAGETVEVSYLTSLGAGLVRGTYVNTVLPTLFGTPIGNEARASVRLASDPLFEEATILGKVWHDRDADNWQDNADATGVFIKGGFSAAEYVPNSTSIDSGDGPQAIADASSPLLHGISLGTITGRRTNSDPIANHRVIISQLIKTESFTSDLVLTSHEGTELRMQADGTSIMNPTGKLAQGNGSQQLKVERSVALEGGNVRLSYIISNIGLHELGVPGVRLATVEGLISETDAHGRYHLAGIDVEHMARGRNFAVKVDPATLPPNSKFTTENPRVRRITQGLLARFDFGVQISEIDISPTPQTIEIEATHLMFEKNTSVLQEKYQGLLDEMSQSISAYAQGDIYITATAGEESLALDRAQVIHRALLVHLTSEQKDKVSVHVVNEIMPQMQPIVSVGQTVRLGEVFFDTDRSQIKAEYNELMHQIAERLVKSNGGVITITGNTDKRGSNKYNQALSERRARAVAALLKSYMSAEEFNKVKIHYRGEVVPQVSVLEKGGDI